MFDDSLYSERTKSWRTARPSLRPFATPHALANANSTLNSLATEVSRILPIAPLISSPLTPSSSKDSLIDSSSSGFEEKEKEKGYLTADDWKIILKGTKCITCEPGNSNYPKENLREGEKTRGEMKGINMYDRDRAYNRGDPSRGVVSDREGIM